MSAETSRLQERNKAFILLNYARISWSPWQNAYAGTKLMKLFRICNDFDSSEVRSGSSGTGNFFPSVLL